MYATLADLLAAASPDELAEAASTDASVTGALLARAIAEGWPDLTGDIPGDADDPTSEALDKGAVQATITAIARLETELDAACAIVTDGLGAKRPAANDTSHDAILRVRTLDIALYRIFRPADADSTSPATRAYRAAIQWLEDVRRGDIALATQAPSNPPLIDSPRRVFTRASLQDFTRGAT